MPNQQQTQLTTGSRNKGLSYLVQFPADQLYRLYVDPPLLNTTDENGPLGFDRRHQRKTSAILSALGGLLYSLQNYPKASGTWIDKQLIIEMHERVIECYPNQSRLPLRTEGHFPIQKRQASYNGIQQFLQSLTEPENTNWAKTVRIVKPNGQHIINGTEPEYIKANIHSLTDQISDCISEQRSGCYYSSHNKLPALQKLIHHCNQSLNALWQSSKPDIDQVINTVAYYIQRFEQLHPLGDGNGRVFVNNMANYLLINFGLPPVIYQDPHTVDMHSVQQVANAIKQGCRDTLNLIQGHNNLHNFDHHEWVQHLQPKDRNRLQNMAHHFYVFQQHIEHIVQSDKAKVSTSKMVPTPSIQSLAISLKDPNVNTTLLKKRLGNKGWKTVINNVDDFKWLLDLIHNNSRGLNSLVQLLHYMDESVLTTLVDASYNDFLYEILPRCRDRLKRLIISQISSALTKHMNQPEELIGLLEMLRDHSEDFYSFPRWLFATLDIAHLQSIINTRDALAYVVNNLRRLDHYKHYQNHLSLLDYLTNEGIIRLIPDNQAFIELIRKTNHFHFVFDLLERLNNDQLIQLIGSNQALINVLRALSPTINTLACETQCSTGRMVIDLINLYLNKLGNMGFECLFEGYEDWNHFCQALRELDVSDTRDVYHALKKLKSLLDTKQINQPQPIHDADDLITIPPSDDETMVSSTDTQFVKAMTDQELITFVQQHHDQRSVILQAVKHNGLLLEHASPELRADPVIAQHALQQNYEAIRYVSNVFNHVKHANEWQRSLIDAIEVIRKHTQNFAENMLVNDLTSPLAGGSPIIKAGATFYRELIGCLQPCFKTEEPEMTQLNIFVYTALNKAKISPLVSTSIPSATVSSTNTEASTQTIPYVSQAITKFNPSCYHNNQFIDIINHIETCLVALQHAQPEPNHYANAL